MTVNNEQERGVVGRHDAPSMHHEEIETKIGREAKVDPRIDSRIDNAFRRELVSHLPHLRAVARALSGHRDRADDLVNDTVLKALSAEAQFQAGTNLKAWLMTILRNHYINGLRRNKIEVETIGEIPEGALPTAPNQEHVVEVSEVGAALQLMSIEHREILVLVSAAGLSYEEAADICGCAVGTIKSRLNRARGELKRVLARSSGKNPAMGSARAGLRRAIV
jgi:RNA polymerase sigma-70 factor (ECF subfamily)